MKKSGFTMVELIFVIVILGILAAVALPRLSSMGDDAKKAKLVEFIGQLNSTVAPQMWASKVKNGGTGAISGLDLKSFVEIPSDWGTPATPIACSTTATATAVLTPYSTTKYAIYCREGNTTDQPKFGFSTTGSATAVDFNTTL